MTDQNYQAMRQAMVETQLRTNDVNDLTLIKAILAVPRETFLPDERRAAAYVDRSVPLSGDRALNPVLATARLLAEARPQPEETVLLVGAATGYAAALLAQLGCVVVALEEAPDLVAMARKALANQDNVNIEQGPLARGSLAGAPYDLIVVDGAIEAFPDALIEQLKVGGRAVFASVDRSVTRLNVGVRSAGGFGARTFVDSDAVVLPGFSPPKSFTF